jgi:ABC-2 type transport system ATP-binding protein
MIRVSHLTKKYGATTAVDDISFEIQQGEIVGYLGPNGAGKSTTLKMLIGLLQPTSGEISVAGYDAATELLELKRHIGYVPEEAQLYEHLTLVEHLQLIGRLYHVEEQRITEKIKGLARLFDMEAQANQRISGFSQGMRQKCLIMSALLHNPDVLFLDEPFTNLDVTTVTLMKTVLQRLAELGKTILYCTHILEVAETLCPRIMIINAGKLIADASVEELREQTNQTALNEIFTQLTETTGIGEKTEEAIRIVMEGTQDA